MPRAHNNNNDIALKGVLPCFILFRSTTTFMLRYLCTITTAINSENACRM